MANGVLGKGMTQANSSVVLYTVPANMQFATITVSACNQDQTNDVSFSMAVTSAANATPADYIEFGAILPVKGGVLERTCLVLSPGEKVIVQASSSEVSVRVFGLEQA